MSIYNPYEVFIIVQSACCLLLVAMILIEYYKLSWENKRLRIKLRRRQNEVTKFENENRRLKNANKEAEKIISRQYEEIQGREEIDTK